MTLQPINSLHMYDPRLRIWVSLHPMNYSRENFPAVTMDNKLYALGGSTVATSESSAVARIQALTVSDNTEAGASSVASGSDEPTAPPSTVCLRACEW